MSQTSGVIPAPRALTTEPRRSDKVFRGVVTTGGLSSLVILGLIAIFLGYRGYEVLRQEGLGLLPTQTGASQQMKLATLQIATLALQRCSLEQSSVHSLR